MEAGAWSFHLPKSQPRASHWHLQIAKTSLGVVFWAFWVTFLCFLLGCLGSLALATCELFPEAFICQSLGSGGAAGAEISPKQDFWAFNS